MKALNTQSPNVLHYIRETAQKASHIFQLFHWEWGYGRTRRIPPVEEIYSTLVKLVDSIKDGGIAETGRFMVRVAPNGFNPSEPELTILLEFSA